jgi:hypothetical protein
MFSKYSWGDFGLFVLVLVALYYIFVVALFFRPQVAALMAGKKLVPAGAGATPAPRKSRAAAAEDDLVSTSSAYPSAPDEASTETSAGAAENLTSGQEELVKGSLPDSVAATGDNGAPDETAASESTTGSMTTETHQYEEEQYPEIALDEVSEETKKLLRAVSSIEKGTKDGNISESTPTFVDTETDIAYEAAAQPYGNELEDFSVPVTSSLNIVSEQSAVFNADEMSAFLTELQDGPPDTIPSKFADTTLGIVEEFGQRQAAAAAALDDMFATVNMSH